jgi:hypothetical protein
VGLRMQNFLFQRNYLFNGLKGTGNVLLPDLLTVSVAPDSSELSSKSSEPQPDPVNMFHDRARRFNWNQSIALGVIRTSTFGSAEI